MAAQEELLLLLELALQQVFQLPQVLAREQDLPLGQQVLEPEE